MSEETIPYLTRRELGVINIDVLKLASEER